MKKVMSVVLILGMLLLGSVVVSADPGTVPGTEDMQSVIVTPERGR